MERRAIATEKDRNIANRKVGVLEGKVEELDTNLAQALSVISSRDRELKMARVNLEKAEQKYYDVGFDYTDYSSQVMNFEAQWKGFKDGWMVAVEAINLPLTSPFRDPN